MNLREYALKKTVMSDLMNGREKMETREITGKEITICDFDVVSDKDGASYTVYVCREYPDRFMFGGMVLTDLLTGYIAEVGIENAKAEVQRDGLRIKLTTCTTKQGGRSYTKVEVL